ncbi:cryptochrome/photolyase family protein [Gracilimonas mengyeensis]|uniref:Deoxyribodipyrimidine photolyase-related protein n=1 Tax=Gracilimonas mengyeensis TaxID=1302730 RepID=A0A521DC13_9BACT|nr:cryptochrome/photolyase family protein [Gracilimonas mengyeensis]SMO69155.1 deoxyribodipyrimidine photolyase-related protein [Gracilimonas mengyeensis]
MSKQSFISLIKSGTDQADLSNHKKAVFILHDQLNLESWPQWVQDEKPVLIFVESEAYLRSLPFHKKKLIYLLSSLRHFALECPEAGFPVYYHPTEENIGSGLNELLKANKQLQLTYMTPSEWSTREELRDLKKEFKDRVNETSNTFFLADAEAYKDRVKDGWLMEYFYREMRQQTGYLMDGDKPEGGEWNYDEQNREKLPKDHPVPEIAETETGDITDEVIALVEEEYEDHFGKSEGFSYAVTRRQALYRLNEFIDQRLDEFGPYEDAMAHGRHELFHSQLSLYLNNGLILPKEACDKAEKAYQEGKARLNSVEGFIRQIIGWREYVKVYYEAMMPEVREANHFDFKNALPELYWSGETKMNCLQQCVEPVINEGYSHHIPRLMVLSNFSNLTETDPRELNRWFYLAYVDAWEWVVLPNVLGMSTFADGGVLASKPYVSSGNYINKMSDYCKHCDYKISKKTGEDACPFNYLYWNFIDKQRDTFANNQRSSFMVNMLDKKSEEDKEKIFSSSQKFLESLERE